MTPFGDFVGRKCLSNEHLRSCRSRESDQKVIKIRKSFVAPNYRPLRGLWQKNFRAPRVNRYDFLSVSAFPQRCAPD
jgi:hypothetical protein